MQGLLKQRAQRLAQSDLNNGGLQAVCAMQADADLLLDRTAQAPRCRRALAGESRHWFQAARRSIPISACFSTALGMTLLQGYGQTEVGAGDLVATGRASGHQDGYGRPADEGRTEVQALRRTGRSLCAARIGHARLLAQRDGNRARHSRMAGCTPAISDEIDAKSGRIMITDRKKDIIVNDKGDNICAPEDRGYADASA